MSQLSRLDVLTLDQLTALREWRECHGRSWRRELMDHYATGRDANSPALRQIRNQHMTLLPELTPADFTLPLLVRYGTIACDRASGESLRAMGVEVGEYDDEAAGFHVRVNRLAHDELSLHGADFPTDRLWSVDDLAAFPWDRDGGMEAASADALYAVAAKVDYLIHTPELSHSTRASDLNWFSDRLDEINATLEKLASGASKATSVEHGHGKERFNSEQEANAYKEAHQLYGRVPEQLAGTNQWALNFPVNAHVTVRQPHVNDDRAFEVG